MYDNVGFMFLVPTLVVSENYEFSELSSTYASEI